MIIYFKYLQAYYAQYKNKIKFRKILIEFVTYNAILDSILFEDNYVKEETKHKMIRTYTALIAKYEENYVC